MGTRESLDLTKPFCLGSYKIVPEERIIERGGSRVHLEPKVLEVLLVLVGSARQVVSRDKIIETVWPNATISDEALSRCIYQLRKQLRSDAQQPPYIKTIVKKGYCLRVSPTPQRESAAQESPPNHHWIANRPAFLGLAGLILAGLIYLWPATQPLTTTGQTRAIAAANSPAIAVLPFEVLSGDDDRQRLSEGFPEDLLIGLGRLRSLQVTSWASSRRFRLDDHESSEVGELLNVDALLTGTIRILDSRVRVSAELIDARTGTQIWSDAYNDDLDAMYQIHNAIAHEIVRSLNIQTEAFSIDPMTATLAAQELYVEGRYYLNQRNAGSLQHAIRFFELAIESDPSFAEALTGLADAHMLATQYQLAPLQEATEAAQAAVDRALALKPALAEAVASQGLIFLHNGQYQDAANTLRRAAAMNPNYANAHNWLGRAVELGGYPAQALEAYRRGLRLDPLSTILNLNVARQLTITGKVSFAQKYLDTVVEQDPDFPNTYWALGFNSFLQGDMTASTGYFEHAFKLGLMSPYAFAQYAYVQMYDGKFEAAVESLERSESLLDGGQTVIPRAHLYALQRQGDDWTEFAGAMIAIDPDEARYRCMAAQARLFEFDHVAAVRYFEAAQALDPERRSMFLDYDARDGLLFALDYAAALQGTGQLQQADVVLEETRLFLSQLRERGLSLPGVNYTEAALAALSGNGDQALESLRRVAAGGWPGVRLARVDPKFATLRESPEFQAVVNGTAVRRPSSR